MIPQTFDYSAPKTLDEALGLLAEGAKPLAGGMSLIPMMKLRLAAPEHLVDLGRIKDLSYIREQGGETAHRRDHDASRRRKLGAGARKVPAAGRDCVAHRRRAGAQHGHHRRQRRRMPIHRPIILRRFRRSKPSSC